MERESWGEGEWNRRERRKVSERKGEEGKVRTRLRRSMQLACSTEYVSGYCIPIILLADEVLQA